MALQYEPQTGEELYGVAYSPLPNSSGVWKYGAGSRIGIYKVRTYLEQGETVKSVSRQKGPRLWGVFGNGLAPSCTATDKVLIYLFSPPSINLTLLQTNPYVFAHNNAGPLGGVFFPPSYTVPTGPVNTFNVALIYIQGPTDQQTLKVST